MGDLGRGKWYRLNTKACVEDYIHLNVSDLKVKGFFERSLSGWLSWGPKDKPLGKVHIKSSPGLLLIANPMLDQGEVQHISTDQTPCHFGGYRNWFICPDCGRKCSSLITVSWRFSCRKCHKLSYRSQRETASIRAMRNQTKLSEQIFESGSVIKIKKKGMHWKRFERLHRKYLEYFSVV